MKRIRTALFLLLAGLLAGCSSATVDQTGFQRTPPTVDYRPALAVSVADDDTIDGFLIHQALIKDGRNGGFFSRLYPVMMSAGELPASEAVECWRCGIDTGELNGTGTVMKALCHDRGWEAVSHTVTARFYGTYVYDTFESAMRAVKSGEIELVQGSEGNNNTTHIYIESEEKNYWYTPDGKWEEVQFQFIKPKLMHRWREYIAENPTYPIEYQVKDSKFLIQNMLGTEVKTFVPPADSRNFHVWSVASTVYPYPMCSMKAEFLAKNPNKMPLATVAIRWSSVDFDNEDGVFTADDSLFEQWKKDFNLLRESGSYAIILGTHMYLDCWRNVVDSELQSKGGSYPDSYVVPVSRPQDNPAGFLSPDVSTGLDSWGEWKMAPDGTISGHGWYPCPGTRLYQFWKFLLWIQSQGIEIMTVKDNLDRIANRSAEGLWIHPAFLDPYDDQEFGDFHFVGADGSTISNKR